MQTPTSAPRRFPFFATTVQGTPAHPLAAGSQTSQSQTSTPNNRTAQHNLSPQAQNNPTTTAMTLYYRAYSNPFTRPLTIFDQLERDLFRFEHSFEFPFSHTLLHSDFVPAIAPSTNDVNDANDANDATSADDSAQSQSLTQSRTTTLTPFSPFQLAHMPMDVKESEHQYDISVEVAGVNKEDIEVDVEDNVLTVCAARQQEQVEKTDKLHRVERSYGRMQRSVRLPQNADHTRIDASYEDGVLHIVVPKLESVDPAVKRVSVR